MITNLFVKKSNIGNGMHCSSADKLRLGDTVKSPQFGSGVVRAFNPNGTVLVQFNGKKNRSVFPSLLARSIQ